MLGATEPPSDNCACYDDSFFFLFMTSYAMNLPIEKAFTHLQTTFNWVKENKAALRLGQCII